MPKRPQQPARTTGASPHGLVRWKLNRGAPLAYWREAGQHYSKGLKREGATTPELADAWCAAKERYLLRLSRALAEGTAVPQQQRLTVAEGIRRFERDHVERELRPSAQHGYKRDIKQARKCLDVTSLAELDGPALARLRDCIVSRSGPDGRELSPATLNSNLRVFAIACRWWRDRGFIPATLEDIKRTLRPLRMDTPTPRYLSPAECKAVLEAAEHHSRMAAWLTAFLLLTGVRARVGHELRADAVQLPDRVVIPAAMMKGRRDHSLNLALCGASFVELLTALAGQAPTRGPHLIGGAEPLNDKRTREWYGAMRRDGAPADVTWQVLRSTCSTYLWHLHGAEAEARQLAHGISVADRHYVGRDVLGIARGLTLDQAMGVGDVLRRIAGAV